MFGETLRNKCLEKCLSILIHIRVICYYSIVVNPHAHCCACVGLILYWAEKSIMQKSQKTLKCPIFNTCIEALFRRDLESSNFQIISL